MVGDDDKPSLDSLLPQLFSRIDGVGELIVLHTLPSGAQPIAEAIDSQGWPEVLGTIAGENTILIVCRSAEARADADRAASRGWRTRSRSAREIRLGRGIDGGAASD